MTAMTKKLHPRLAALFIVALPIFSWIQWQPETWLNEQLFARGLNNSVRYITVDKAFPGLQLKGVQISKAGMPPLSLETLELSPAISTLLSSTPGLFVRANSEGISAESVITMHDNTIELRDVQLHTDTASLSRFGPGLLLLGLSGTLNLKGHAMLQADTGLPLDGDVDLIWEQPSSTLLPQGIEQAHLNLNAADAEGTKIWNWNLDSTPDIVAGEGKIVANGADSRQWLLRGKLRTAKDGADMVLSGTLGAPHIQ